MSWAEDEGIDSYDFDDYDAHFGRNTKKETKKKAKGKMTETGIMTIGEKAEAAIIEGDLSRLTPAERVAYYNRVCDALGLLATTKPFGYMVLSGKLTLYALKGCTDQLRKIHGVSLVINSIAIEDGICVVSVSATDSAGRSDTDIGAVVCAHLKGEDLANAKMRAVTKAKRRVTLSLCGLGFLDESEVASIPEARVVRENLPAATGMAPKALFWNPVPEAATFHTQTPLPVSVTPLSPPVVFAIPQPPDALGAISTDLLKRIHATATRLSDKLPASWREDMKERFCVESSKDLTNEQGLIIMAELEVM